MLHSPANRSLSSAALFLALATGALQAQEGAIATEPFPRGGFQLHSASAYGIYYSDTLPSASGFPAAAVTLPSDFGFGGSALFEWNKFTDRSTVSLTYAPSYTGRLRFSSINTLDHAFSFNVRKKLAPRWGFGFAAGANLTSLQQFLFAPTTLADVASTPASSAQLFAAILTSQFSGNPQLGILLTNAPTLQSPVEILFYGQRMFTSSVTSSVSYSYSPRLSFSLNVGAGTSRHLPQNDLVAGQDVALIPNSTSGIASFQMSYAASPRTQLGVIVTGGRTSSSLDDLYTTTSVVSLGRTVGRRWFWQVHGGMGLADPVRQTGAPFSTKPLPVIGGGLGFKNLTTTVLGSFEHTVSDQSGLGANSNSTANIGWRWGRPRASWWLDGSVGWQQLKGNGLADTSGWHTTVGFSRAVGPHLAFRTDYVYLRYSGGLVTSAYSLSQSAMRVSLVWYPRI